MQQTELFQKSPASAVNGQVGGSHRTPFKHWLLNSELGRLCGILLLPTTSRSPAVAPLIAVDLCAGTGDEHDSSPRIMFKHCNSMRQHGSESRLILIERHAATFKTLQDNMRECPEWVELLQGDASSFCVYRDQSRQAAFLYADPNHIDDLPLTPGMMCSLGDSGTFLATLGCNVGGLKRKPAEERESWMNYFDAMLNYLPRHHDLLLITLRGDSSQWAYALRLPAVWASGSTARICKKSPSLCGYNAEVFSWRSDRAGFYAARNRLVYTKAELAHG